MLQNNTFILKVLFNKASFVNIFKGYGASHSLVHISFGVTTVALLSSSLHHTRVFTATNYRIQLPLPLNHLAKAALNYLIFRVHACHTSSTKSTPAFVVCHPAPIFEKICTVEQLWSSKLSCKTQEGKL